jgi:DNA modification methylase
MKTIEWELRTYQIKELTDYFKNPRILTEKEFEQLKKSLDRFGLIDKPIINLDQAKTVIGGHQRLRVLRAEGQEAVDCWTPSRKLSAKEVEELNVRLNKNTGQWDFNVLANQFEFDNLLDWGFTENELFGESLGKNALPKSITLAERFGIPPFSVFDARQGYWQARKREWIALGIRGEVGRGANIVPNGSNRPPDQDGAYMRHDENGLLGFSEQARSHYKNAPGGSLRPAARLGKDGKTVRGDGRGKPIKGFGRTFGEDLMHGENPNFVNGVLMTSDSGNDPAYYFKKQQKEKELGRKLSTAEFQEKYYEGPDTYQSGSSIFDPVLCEIAYRWFCRSGGHILDPFAGESTKGIVATYLGFQYTGIELRQEQVDANYEQWSEISERKNAEFVEIKVSAKSARELWNGCQVDYITGTCHGRCCQAGDGSIHIPILPEEEKTIQAAGGKVIDGMLQGKEGGGCTFQENGLCKLHLSGTKPFACTLSPFTLNKSNTLIVKNRNRKLICYKKEPNQMTYKAYSTSLINMFGQEEAARIIDLLDKGSEDFVAKMPRANYLNVRRVINMQRESLGMETQEDLQIESEAGTDPNWILGDSANLNDLIPADQQYDLIFTSPPYYDLEVYSENKADGSTKQTYKEFMAWYKHIFSQAVDHLKDNSFLVVKVGEIRDKKTGIYHNFVGDNISCFIDLGLNYYNEAILVTAVGSLPIRAAKQFTGARKLGKTHQNILIFYKGNPKNIKDNYSKDIEYANLSEQTDQGEDNSGLREESGI